MKYMILNKNKTKLYIPITYLEESGIADYPKLTAHTLDQTLVILPRKLSPLEAIQAMGSLMNLASEMFSALVERCGLCKDCSGEGQCPYEENENLSVHNLPLELCKKLEMPKGNNHTENNVQYSNAKTAVEEEEYDTGLSDVPEWLLNVFCDVGLCLGELDDLIQSEDIIYGD